jgi:tetratricopeptide (TPR) repeat protein
MQEIGLETVCDEIGAAFQKGDLQRVDTLVWPALNQFPDLPQLWFYAGNLLFQFDRAAMAVQAFQRCAELGENPLVLANLGAAYRKLNAHEEGIRVLKAALDRVPDYAPALVNLGSMFVNEGRPNDGIPYLERAVALGRVPGKTPERGAEWNLALLYLEAGRFGEGFDLYRCGLGNERLVRKYGKESKGVPEPAVLQPDSPTEGKTLIVWGEQGIGDELLFATCLPDALAEFGQIIFECHPRLEWLFKQAYPQVRIFPTRKEEKIDWPFTENIRADYKCPIGDLASRYRRNLAAFQAAWRGAPYKYDTVERDSYRRQLEQYANGKKIVGLATRGGVMQTARTYRTLRVPDAQYLLDNTDCLFVSLDYDDMTGFASYCMEKYPGRYVWFPSILQHWDYHHTGALAAACDLVVSVAQSVAHLSAGLGLPTRVLCAKRCAWREASISGLEKEQWYWWLDPKVKLYHQGEDNKWHGPLTRVIEDIKAL